MQDKIKLLNDQIQKLKNDKIKLKGHLKVTRQNNEVLKTMVGELRTKNEEVEDNLRESMVEVANANNKIGSMKKTIKELEKQAEESCRSSDADLIISQQETKECMEELEDKANKNLRCESDKKTCENKLDDQVQKNKNLKDAYSETLTLLEESRSLSSANENLAQECQNNLETEVEEKEVLQEKLKLFCQNQSSWGEWSHCSGTCGGKRTRIDRCLNNDEQIETCNEDQSLWGEWSDCSKTCQGIKTRIDRCSNNGDQIGACNEDISCSKSGKY